MKAVSLQEKNEQKESLFLKGVKTDHVQWFKANAIALGYKFNEFFDLLIAKQIEAENGSSDRAKSRGRKKAVARKRKTRARY